jgi:hypothetical protein
MRKNNWHEPLPPVDLDKLAEELNASFARQAEQRAEVAAMIGTPRQWRKSVRNLIRKYARWYRQEMRIIAAAGDIFPRSPLSVYAPTPVDIQVSSYNATLHEKAQACARDMTEWLRSPGRKALIREQIDRWRRYRRGRVPA